MRLDEIHEWARAYDRLRAARVAEARSRADTAREVLPRLAQECRAWGATRVVLFGSLAGTVRPARDVDLAVEGVPAERFFDLYGALLALCPLPLDLVDLGDCPDPLREAIARDGVEL